MLFAACTIYKITEWVRLEGITLGPLVQSPSQGHPRGLRWFLDISSTGISQPLWAIFSSEIFRYVLPSFILIYFLLKTLWEEKKQNVLHEEVI